jgi:hypothetical protein
MRGFFTTAQVKRRTIPRLSSAKTDDVTITKHLPVLTLTITTSGYDKPFLRYHTPAKKSPGDASLINHRNLDNVYVTRWCNNPKLSKTA